MAERRIVLYGDPVLREKAAKVDEINQEVKDLVSDLVDALKGAQGLGLAAPQIGVSKRVFVVDLSVIDLSESVRVFINPEIVQTDDEIELLKQAAAMVDAVYEDISRAIRPGTREHELVALANEKLFLMGAERVECVNSVSGARGNPHSHTFSDRMIQPGDMVFLDLMHAFNGYRTCRRIVGRVVFNLPC